MINRTTCCGVRYYTGNVEAGEDFVKKIYTSFVDGGPGWSSGAFLMLYGAPDILIDLGKYIKKHKLGSVNTSPTLPGDTNCCMFFGIDIIACQDWERKLEEKNKLQEKIKVGDSVKNVRKEGRRYGMIGVITSVDGDSFTVKYGPDSSGVYTWGKGRSKFYEKVSTKENKA